VIVLGAAIAASLVYLPWLAILPVVLLALVLQFFRDPERLSPAPPVAVISPADGKVVDISAVDEPEHVGGKAKRIAIFMSVFDVHVNRSPVKAKVEWVRHVPGRFMNAVRSAAGLENERLLVALRDEAGRPALLNLVAGFVARRIVCALSPGQTVHRGQRIGMIRFGSRVEVFVPDDDRFEVAVRLGQAVRAGRTVLGEWR